jgi:hypothetical protein
MEKILTHSKGSSQVDIFNFSKKLKSLHLTVPENILNPRSLHFSFRQTTLDDLSTNPRRLTFPKNQYKSGFQFSCCMECIHNLHFWQLW